MADDQTQTAPPTKKRGLLLPLLVGVVLAILGGGGGFWAVRMGPFASGQSLAATGSESEIAQESPLPPITAAFVPLETLVISLGPEQSARHLMFSAELEVDPAYLAEVTQLSPRVLDVLNGYLRVISVAELSDPTSLARLRAQMLRRIQTVTGAGKVQDLLVTQFVVN